MCAKNRILPIFVPHQGCPNDCVFCNQRKISGFLVPATGDTVRGALEALQTPGVELAFYGGSFTAIGEKAQRALLEAARPYRESGAVTHIRVSTRPDAISPAALELLREYGVDTVELGAQSMDDGVLRLSGRGHTARDTVNAARLLRENGFSFVLQMMTGLPGADAARDLESARRLLALRPDAVRVYPTVVVRDTPLEALWRRGEYRPHTVEAAVETCAPIAELFLSAGMPVLRMGLNPTAELSGGEALAGAYHPALGELVYGRVALERARRLLREAGGIRRVILQTHPSWVSKTVGQKGCNRAALRAEFGLETLRVEEKRDLPPGTLAIRALGE